MDVPSQATSIFARMIEEVVVVRKVKQMKKTIAMATKVATIMALEMVEDIK